MDTNYNPTATQTSLGAVANTASRTKFKENGYYYVPAVVVDTLKNSLSGEATGAVDSTGLNAIFLNTQWCDNRNFALMKEAADPAGMLTWLKTTLATFE